MYYSVFSLSNNHIFIDVTFFFSIFYKPNHTSDFISVILIFFITPDS